MTKQYLVEFLQNLEDFHLNGGKGEKYFTPDQLRIVDKYLVRKEGLKELERSLKALPVILLALAFNPTVSQIENLSLWFEKNFGKKVVLDISRDESILAGVVVGIKGRMWDYALR